jgi:hypothetical protein
MNPEEWLSQNAIGYSSLDEFGRSAIANFSLLWSLFEANKFERNANPTRILAKVNQWHAAGVLDIAAFSAALAYFRTRYYENGKHTHHFESLNFRPRDRRGLVARVMSGKARTDSEVVSALLLIVYRLRNNLFHGEKWAYGIAGQRPNFECANSVLMLTLNLS